MSVSKTWSLGENSLFNTVDFEPGKRQNEVLLQRECFLKDFTPFLLPETKYPKKI